MKLSPTTEDISFDDATTHAMGKAFDEACKSLHEFGTRDAVRETIAKRIIEAAKNGEKSHVRFYEHALLAFDVSVIVGVDRDFSVAHPSVTQKA